MNMDTWIIRGRFRQHYQLIVNHRVRPHPQAKAVRFQNAESSLRFLRDLDVDSLFWSRALWQLSPAKPKGAIDDTYAYLSVLILHHQIEFYELPNLRQHMIHDGMNKAYHFMKGPSLNLSDSDITPQSINNEAEAEALLSELTADDEYWQKVLAENNVQANPTGNAASTNPLGQVASLLASGELIAYQAPYTPAPPKREVPVLEAVVNNDPVPLGPHETEDPVVKKSFKFLISS